MQTATIYNHETVQLDGEARELRLLVDHRDDLVEERTKVQSRLRWHLHELFPGLEIAPRALRRYHVMTEVEERLQEAPGTVASIARELVGQPPFSQTETITGTSTEPLNFQDALASSTSMA